MPCWGYEMAAVTVQSGVGNTRWDPGRQTLRAHPREVVYPEPRAPSPCCIPRGPTGLCLQNTDARNKLFRISRGQLQSIKPSVGSLSVGLNDTAWSVAHDAGPA